MAGKKLLSMWNNWKKEKKTTLNINTISLLSHCVLLSILSSFNLFFCSVQQFRVNQLEHWHHQLLIQIFPTPTYFSDHVWLDLNIQRICCDGWKTNRNLQQQRSVIQIYQNTKHMLYWSCFSLSGKNSNNNIYTLEACSLQCDFSPHSFDS